MTADDAAPGGEPPADTPGADDGPGPHEDDATEAALPGEQPGDIPFEQAAAEHENPALE
jgi:hypothetical protein